MDVSAIRVAEDLVMKGGRAFHTSLSSFSKACSRFSASSIAVFYGLADGLLVQGQKFWLHDLQYKTPHCDGVKFD